MNWLRELVALPHYKLLAFAIALTTWFYVQGVSTVEVSHRASLAWRIPGDTVPTEPLPGSVVVMLSGSLNAARRAEDANLVIVVDLEGASPGPLEVNFADVPLVGVPPGLSVASYQPASHSFSLDLADTRSVEIRPEVVGEPGKGYAVEAITLSPSVVTLVGPREVMESLPRVPTRPIDVSGLTERTTVNVELALPRGVDMVVDQPTVSATLVIEPLLQRRTLAHVPIVLPEVAGNLSVDAVSVSLEGPRALLAELDPASVIGIVRPGVELSETALSAVCGAKEGPRVDIVHPAADRVRVVGCKPATVEVRKP